MKLFDQLLTNSLRKAFLEEMKSSVMVSDEVYQELKDYVLSSKLDSDIASLRNGVDPFLPYRKIEKYCVGKMRTFFVADGNRKLFAKYVTFAARDAERPFVEGVCTSAEGPSVVDSYKSLLKTDPERSCYVIVGDVRHYTDDLDENVVRSRIEELFPGDNEAQTFFMQNYFIDEYLFKGNLVRNHIFTGAGHPLAPLMANTYLWPMDKELVSNALAYSRYYDDFVAVFKTREEAECAYARMQEIAKDLKIEMHPTKTRIVRPGESYAYLGLEVTPVGTDFCPKQIAEWKRLINQSSKQLIRQVRSGKISGQLAMRLFAIGINSDFMSKQMLLWASPWLEIITKIDGIKSIDHHLQDSMRAIGTGKTGPARYRISYQELKRAGYKNLVHLYYRRAAIKKAVLHNG